MKERLQLLDRSTLAQVTGLLLAEAQRTHGDVSGFQAWPTLANELALYEGRRLDDIAARYASDIQRIDNFNASSQGQHFHAALGAATKALATQTVADRWAFVDAEDTKFRSKWKAQYAANTR